MMTLRRFRTLADSYGADLQRWPQRVRAQALALLARSAEAQAIMARAAEVDEAIATAGAERLERLWGGESADAALHRLQDNVAAHIRRSSSAGMSARHQVPGAPGRTRSPAMRYPPGRAGWVGLATAAGVAVLAGLALGILYSPPAPQEDLTTLLQPAPLQVLTDSP